MTEEILYRPARRDLPLQFNPSASRREKARPSSWIAKPEQGRVYASHITCLPESTVQQRITQGREIV